MTDEEIIDAKFEALASAMEKLHEASTHIMALISMMDLRMSALAARIESLEEDKMYPSGTKH